MKEKDLKGLVKELKVIGEKIREVLGAGFTETIYQNALAIEFRKRNIEYLKEVNIEIFYEGESVGTDRPDFIITKWKDIKNPVILEIKVANKISDDYKRQLKSYCISLPHNNNPVFKNFSGAILMLFPKGEVEQEEKSEIQFFTVDDKFDIIEME